MTTTLLMSIALYLVTDSAGSIVSDASLHVDNTIVATTSYDGLLRYDFPSDVETVDGILTARGYDTLTVSLHSSANSHLQRLYMTHSAHHSPSDDVFVGASLGAMKTSRATLSTKTKAAAPMADAEPISDEIAVEDDVAFMFLAEEAEAVYEVMDVDTKVSSYRGVAKTNLPSAGKLTAGEVNDFAKWSLWSGIIDNSHKEYINTWQLLAKNRYRVAVVNTEQYPLADITVELLDSYGKVIFSTKTDNTGHAELWADIFPSSQSSQPQTIIAYSRDGKAVTTNSIKPYPAVEVISLSESCGAPENVDVFFIADATGSMGDELRYLKAEMLDVINRSQAAVGDAKIRTGALVYRDHGDMYISRISPLNDDITVTRSFLEKQEAGGGGDYPEAVPEALLAAINSADWSTEARARIAFLILDAPCHTDSATLSLLHRQIMSAAHSGIRIVPVVCSGLQKDGELLMRELSLLTNGTSFFLTDDSGIGNTHLKPTTDSLKVEHLNDMLVRTIIEFSTMPECDAEWAKEALTQTETDNFVPNPFNVEDLDSVPTILPVLPIDNVLIIRPNPCRDICFADLPSGSEALYLCDISGKTIQSLGRFGKETVGLMIDTSSLPTGVYFVKSFYGGRWYTKKLIVA
ncbi:MAG: T9SS type A sorting domain-containing protein [Paludibacteraceae bacterium]|nr:T9SS type A sorting domain-containing protein [Paludibacteraceae bacterium]